MGSAYRADLQGGVVPWQESSAEELPTDVPEGRLLFPFSIKDISVPPSPQELRAAYMGQGMYSRGSVG